METTARWESWASLTVLGQAGDPASGLLMGGASSTGNSSPAGTLAPGTSAAPGAGSSGGAQPGFPIGMFVLVIGFMVLMIIMTGSSQRREKKRMAQLLANLRKHDRVLTIGGIVGTVAEIRDDEIVLRVDENSNTRIRFTKNAIQQVLKPADAGGSTASASGSASDPKVEVVAGKREKATI